MQESNVGYCVYNLTIIKSYTNQEKNNIADPLSRLCTNVKPRPFEDETYVHLIVETSCPTAVPLSEIKRTSRADGELRMVRDSLYNGKWNQEVNNYKTFDTELCFQDEQSAISSP